MTNYYLGKIVEVIDRVTYEVRVDIDGIVESKPAFPFRGEVDEPKVGDQVLLRNIDPIYQSMYLYSKLKEDDVIGFRSNGKQVDITPDRIIMSVYKRNDNDANKDADGEKSYESRIVMNSDGSMIIESKGPMTIKSPMVTLKGPGTFKVKGKVKGTLEGGPFCAFAAGPAQGQLLVSGDTITLEDF